MRKINTLITQRQQGSSGQLKPVTNKKKIINDKTKKLLTSGDIDTLWLRMAQLYGNKFVSNYGEADDGTWLALLKYCTRDDIKIGLRALVKISAQRARTQDEDWPPSALEFRSLCKPPRPLPSHRSFPKITKGKQTREPEFIKQRISELRNAMSK